MREHEKGWLSAVLFRKLDKRTGKPLAGTAVEVLLRVRADGSGNIQTRLREDGPYDNNQPVANVDDAMRVLRAVWEQGQHQQ
jgi:hypothetical protein